MQINVTRAAILKKYLRKYFRQYFANDAGDKQVELRNSLTVSPISFDSSSTSIINEFSIFIIDEFSSLVNFSSEQTTTPFVVSAEDILRKRDKKFIFNGTKFVVRIKRAERQSGRWISKFCAARASDVSVATKRARSFSFSCPSRPKRKTSRVSIDRNRNPAYSTISKQHHHPSSCQS